MGMSAPSVYGMEERRGKCGEAIRMRLFCKYGAMESRDTEKKRRINTVMQNEVTLTNLLTSARIKN